MYTSIPLLSNNVCQTWFDEKNYEIIQVKVKIFVFKNNILRKKVNRFFLNSLNLLTWSRNNTER